MYLQTGALRDKQVTLHEQQVRARPRWIKRQGLQQLMQRHIQWIIIRSPARYSFLLSSHIKQDQSSS